MSSFGRRSFLKTALVGAGVGLGATFARPPVTASAAPGDPEHFFIFIELKGGVHWMLATDGRDLSELPMSDTNVVRKVEVTADGNTPRLAAAAASALITGNGATDTHGNVILLPYIGRPEDSYKKGKTTLGADYILGFAGFPLEKNVDDIAVIRGVRGIHNFHGGANDEIFCGLHTDQGDQARRHIGGVIAAQLARDKGAKLLDNVVFEGANFAGEPGENFWAPTRIDVQTLGNLASVKGATPEATRARFLRAQNLIRAVGAGSPLGRRHKEAVEVYANALGNAPAVQQKLIDLAASLGRTDASLDLNLQVDAALTMFESGLTRVATLCLGANNGKNGTDGFGLFDAHYGMVHGPKGTSTRTKTYKHYQNVSGAMTSIARLIGELKRRTKNGKSLWEQTTVVIGTEFARPSNAVGNEDQEGGYGAGHYQWNNNFILMGKGVRGGAWLGKNHAVTQYHHLVKMSSLDQTDPTKVETALPASFTLDKATNIYSVGATEGTFSTEKTINFAGGAQRPIMSKDVMRTVLSIAGQDSRFGAVYSGAWFKDARILKPVTG